jgi:hypothetical protein
MIKGEKIYLTELDWANSEIIRGWLNDPEVHEYSVGHTPITREEERQYFEAQAAETDRHTSIHLATTDAIWATSGSRYHPAPARGVGLVIGRSTIGEGLRSRRHRHMSPLRLRYPRPSHR